MESIDIFKEVIGSRIYAIIFIGLSHYKGEFYVTQA